MSEWITIIISLISTISASGILFFTIDKKLKKLEVSDKEVEIIKKQDDEWQELYNEAKERIRSISHISEELRKENNDLKRQIGMLELKVQQLSWYRCTVNNCKNRRPPHVYDHEGNELEHNEQE